MKRLYGDLHFPSRYLSGFDNGEGRSIGNALVSSVALHIL